MSAAVQSPWPAETAGGLPREIVSGELSYLVPMRERAYRYEKEVPPGATATNMRYHAQSVTIENARIARPPSLECEGFAFETRETPAKGRELTFLQQLMNATPGVPLGTGQNGPGQGGHPNGGYP